jgi:hypothetical protein
MGTSTELPLAAERVPPAPSVGSQIPAAPLVVEDEEFPANLPNSQYDWLLQPASERGTRRGVGIAAVILAAIVLTASAFFAHNISRAFPSVLASPPASSSR